MKLTGLAQKLRDDSTDAERLLWSRVRRHALFGHKFRRQVPIGNYIVDFVCFSSKVIVELDGGQHANNAGDRVRDTWLQGAGFRVLRFWNTDVLANIDGVIEVVLKHLSPSPQPSPIKGEGARENRTGGVE
jgi:very-short-patch-repair endonuclease